MKIWTRSSGHGRGSLSILVLLIINVSITEHLGTASTFNGNLTTVSKQESNLYSALAVKKTLNALGVLVL